MQHLVAAFKKAHGFRRGHSFAEEVALADITPLLQKAWQLRILFDALDDRLDFKAPAEVKKRLDGFVAPVALVSKRRDETVLNVDLVELVSSQLCQAGISGTKVVERDLDTGNVQFVDDRGSQIWI